jgi:hypothetical protein
MLRDSLQRSFPWVSCLAVVHGTFDIGELVNHVSHSRPVPAEAHDPPWQGTGPVWHVPSSADILWHIQEAMPTS